MKILVTKSLTPEQRESIYQLWNNEYPSGLLFSELSEFREHLWSMDNIDHFLILSSDEEVIAWSMIFDRDGQRWFSIIVDTDYQGNKLGTKLVKKLKENEEELYGWVVDHDNDRKASGEKYKSPLNFYKRNGFVVVPEERYDNEKVSAVMIRWKKPVEIKQTAKILS